MLTFWLLLLLLYYSYYDVSKFVIKVLFYILYISISIYIYLSIYLSIYPSIYLPTCLLWEILRKASLWEGPCFKIYRQRICTFTKKESWQRYFPGNFQISFRVPFISELVWDAHFKNLSNIYYGASEAAVICVP